jgi:hypothetical protein
MRRTPADLRAISADVLYELQMLFLMADRLRRHQNGELMRPADIEMACIEDLTVHARALEEFIWGEPRPRYPDDAFAADFFAEGAWETIRANIQRSALTDLRRRTGHEIVHLSYRRLQVTEEARPWKFDVIADVIGKAFRLFLEHLPYELLCDEFEARLRGRLPEHQNYPVAIGFPPDCETAHAITIATEPFYDLTQFPRATFEEMLPRNG